MLSKKIAEKIKKNCIFFLTSDLGHDIINEGLRKTTKTVEAHKHQPGTNVTFAHNVRRALAQK